MSTRSQAGRCGSSGSGSGATGCERGAGPPMVATFGSPAIHSGTDSAASSLEPAHERDEGQEAFAA